VLCLRSVPCAMATVQVQNLTFWGSNDEFLLKGVTAVARPGELLGILGGSGAGKRYGLAFVPCAYLRCADPMPLWLALSYASVLLSRYLAVVLARRG